MRFALIFIALVGCKQSAPARETEDVMTIDAASVVQLTVDVRADGTLAVDGRTVPDENAIADEARAVAQKTPLIHAVIYVAEGVAYDRVIATEQALKRGGVAHISFGVRGTKDATP